MNAIVRLNRTTLNTEWRSHLKCRFKDVLRRRVPLIGMGRFRQRRFWWLNLFSILRRRQRRLVFLPSIPRILFFRMPGKRHVRRFRIGEGGVFGAPRSQEPTRATIDHSVGLWHRHLDEITAADSPLPHLVYECRDLLAWLDLEK